MIFLLLFCLSSSTLRVSNGFLCIRPLPMQRKCHQFVELHKSGKSLEATVSLTSFQPSINGLGVLSGALSTFGIIHYTSFQAFATPIIGIFGSILRPTWSPSIYCGSFIGAAALTKSHSLQTILFVSAIAIILYEKFDQNQLFIGYGGRLGFIAFAAGVLFQLQKYMTTIIWPASISMHHWLTSFISILIGAISCQLMRSKLSFSAVLSSSFVGLISSLLRYFNYFPLDTSRMLWCGSFIAMSTPLLRVEELLSSSAIASLFVCLFQAMQSSVEGQLGAAALGGVLVTKILTVQSTKISTKMNSAYKSFLRS